MTDYIEKDTEGNFTITSAGEQEVLAKTTKKLIEFYLKEALKKNPGEINSTSSKLDGFLYKNFFSMNDYLSKLNDLAGFIEENSLERFQRFMGQYFMPTFQKEKASFLQKEIDKNKEKLNNPYWTPSYELLRLYSSKFDSSPILKFIPEGSEDIEVEEEHMPVSPKEEEIPDLNPPGIYFLMRYEKQFIDSPPLKGIHISTEAERLPGKEPRIPKHSEEPHTMADEIVPGKRLLELYGEKFNKSPRLDLQHAAESSQTLSKEKLFSIKGYASLLNNISRFNKSNDKEGYQKWYVALEARKKAVIKINSLLIAENKGATVNWGKEILNCAVSLGENKSNLYLLSGEVKIYSKIIQKIRYQLTHQTPPLDTSAISNIYSQAIIILSSDDTEIEKKAALKILLLQIPDEKNRMSLISEMEGFVDLIG